MSDVKKKRVLNTVDATRRTREWRKANPERLRAQNERYAARHPENIRAKYRRCASKRRAQNPELWLWTSAKNNAAQKGREFTITVDDIVIPERCPILHVKFAQVGTVPRTCNPSVDRVDNKLGYVPGNVRVISCGANSWKGARSVDDVRRLLAYMEGAA